MKLVEMHTDTRNTTNGGPKTQLLLYITKKGGKERRKLNLQIIHELGSNKNTCNEQTMNIKGVDRQQWLPLSKAIKINISNNEARVATIGILEDPFKVGMKRDRWASQAMERRVLLRFDGRVIVHEIVVRLGHSLKHRREESDELWHHGGAFFFHH